MGKILLSELRKLIEYSRDVHYSLPNIDNYISQQRNAINALLQKYPDNEPLSSSLEDVINLLEVAQISLFNAKRTITSLAMMALAVNDCSEDCSEEEPNDEFCEDSNQVIWYGKTDCAECGREIHGNLYDGRLKGDTMWSTMCENCFRKKGAGIGWGIGQRYQENANGDFVLVEGGENE